MSEPPDALVDKLDKLGDRIFAALERNPGLGGGAAPGDSGPKPHAKSFRPKDSAARVPIAASSLSAALRSACAAVGTVDRDVPADGRWYKADIDGDPRGRGDGRIKLFADGEGGIVCNWKSGESLPFFVDDGRKLTQAERRDRERRRAEAIRLAEEEKARSHAEAREKGKEIWNGATPALDDHAYLLKKRVMAHGLRVHHGALVIPIRDGAELHSLQFIEPDGAKRFLPGGRVIGCYFSIGKQDSVLCITEGYATGASIHEATGHAVAVAFHAGNLLPVARALRAKFRDLRLIVCADDDFTTPGNPGLTKASEAAQSVGGLVAVPDFGENRFEGATDFNDVHRIQGLEAVGECIRRQIFSQDDVPDVPGVQPRRGAGSSRNVTKKPDVPDVPGAAEDHRTPEDEEGERAAKDPLPQPSERPCFRVFDEWIEHQNGKLRPGVWFFAVKHGRKAEDPDTLTQQWVCSPLHIDAVTFDGQSNNFGRLLRFKNTIGTWREWAMPMELLRGLGDEMRGELLAMGVEIDPRSKTLLGQYLQSVHPKRRMHCALQVGWCGDSFVLPDEVVGPRASGVIFQSGEHRHDEYTRAGTLDGWQSEVAARAPGNPLLVQALSASFAGPLLKRCNAEGGGLHFTGDSSIGKTAAIDASCSTWGGANFRRSWKTTANGMEGAAAMSNDGLLALDEISECDPREVGTIVYALSNGLGKQRASRTGSARPVTRWRCFVLSSGERSVGTHMAEGGRRAKAGQSVRLLDVPVSEQFGAWDNLHGLPTGAAFSDEIKRASVAHHGHAGRAFLEKLTRDTRNFCEWLERIKALPKFSVEGGEGQDKRAAARFALVALAGEVATEYGITGWEEGTAIEAAAEGFKAWRSLRGRGNDERWKILEAVSDFIEQHGDSRFSSTERVECYGRENEYLSPDTRLGAEAIIRDRAGWWEDEGDERVYLFNAAGMREALAGFDFQPALDALQKAGALPPSDASGSRSRSRTIGGRKAKVRVYTVRPGKLEVAHEP